MRLPDDLFADRRLAAVYDLFEGDRSDLDHYVAMVVELGARSILDIGCGTGELACRLAGRGLSVIGVDPAAASIDIARSKPGAGDVTWIVGDATAVPDVEVDATVMTGNVAQVFVDDADWNATLDAVAAAVRPGGHLVFETRRPEVRAWERWTAEQSRSTAVTASGEPVESWNEVTSVVGDLVTFRSTVVFGSDGAVATSNSTLRFRSCDEIADSLHANGFAVADVRDAPDRPGREMVFIAQRV